MANEFGPFPNALPPANPYAINTNTILNQMGLLVPKDAMQRRPVAPAALKPRALPQQDQGGAYTPEQVLKSQADTANWYQSRPLAPMAGGGTAATIAGGFANAGNGFMGTYLPRQAEEKMTANQRLSERAMQEALGSKDLTGMMKSLAASGNPKYQDMAAQQMLQRGAAQESAQEDMKRKMDAFNGIMGAVEGGSSPQAQQPAAGGYTPPSDGIAPPAAPAPMAGADGAPAAPAPAPEPPVVFVPPPRGKLDPTQRAIIGANIIGIPKEAAERLDPSRHANEAQDKETGKGYGERFQKIMASRDAAYQRQNDMQLLEHLTLNPDTLMGPGAESISVRLRRGLAALGVPTGELQSLNATQLYQGLMGRMALEARNPANGAGMPGAMSDADREFLQKITGGMPNTREANIAMVRVHQLQAQRQLDLAKNATEYAANNNGRLDIHFDRLQEKWAKQNPLFKEKDFAGLFDTTPPGQRGQPGAAAPGVQPSAQPAAAAPPSPQFIESAIKLGIPKDIAGSLAEGQPITNKRTGIQYVRRNGQLVEVPLDDTSTPERPSFMDIMTLGQDELKAKDARFKKWEAGQKSKAPAKPNGPDAETRMMINRGELR